MRMGEIRVGRGRIRGYSRVPGSPPPVVDASSSASFPASLPSRGGDTAATEMVSLAPQALGSSAPEIFLAVIDIVKKDLPCNC